MKLCLGTAQLGMQYGIQSNERPDKYEVDGILSTALENGICWFDTASAYGDAEKVLGSYILEHPDQTERMHITSKLCPDAFLNVPSKRWRDIALEQASGTLRRLNRQQLDVYMFHNASYIFSLEAVEALDSVRQEGLADRIGVSVYTPDEAMRALEYPQIGAIQIPYNVFDRRLDQCGFFKDASEKNVQVYARSSLLQGLAVMRPEQLPAHMEFAEPYLKQFRSICEDAGISQLQAAIGFTAKHAGIQYLVFGVDSRMQLLEYMQIVSVPLSYEILKALKDGFGTVEEKLVNPSLWKS